VAVLAGQARELLRCLISESIEQVDRQVTHLGEAIRITVASGAEISFLCNFGRFEIWDHIEGVGWEPVEQAPAGRILSIRPLAEGDGLLIDVDGTDLWVLYERFRRLVFEPADRYSNRASAVELSGPVDTRPVLKQLSTRREDSSQALLDAMVGAHHAWEQKDSQAMTMQTDRFLSGLGWDAFRLLAVRETLIATVDAPLRGLKRLSNGFVAQIACTDQRDAYDWACIYEESLWTAAAHAGFTAEIAVALDGKDFTLTLI
jgi:hypothetical protein